ncbi:hypothetical protein WICMUC_004993 [Wickerhamomyces mucosus]|uniref:tRNA-dihydrouridine(47) synthase [NAD(P)(+)] n=1 Tax=Wickerhamomyces mucosus TaxID=1378264 RepID=A0A9P8T851_9ASCO|nr:hypothetical protein WICMUC_004993 [Wickerhamomyces mucosus]
MAEEIKRPGSPNIEGQDSKKLKVVDDRDKGVAYIKLDYKLSSKANAIKDYDDDKAEASGDRDGQESGKSGSKKGGKKRGQNKARDLRQEYEENRLCASLIDPSNGKECKFGKDNCRYIHDIKIYLEKKPKDIEGTCPVFVELGYCPVGFKCRFLHSHLNEETLELIKDDVKFDENKLKNHEVNHISNDDKFSLVKKRFEFIKANEIIKIIDEIQDNNKKIDELNKKSNQEDQDEKLKEEIEEETDKQEIVKNNYNSYKDTRYFAGEKKKLDLHHKKIVSPLTTVGNLPYRRLMRHLGADVTYSEMALTLPLIQGTNSEWALPKAHSSEIPGFGIQIATAKPWQAAKATEVLAKFAPNCSEINLNSGCPIDLLYRQGMGSGLLEQPGKTIRILNSMNYCSGEIPTTLKIRMGTLDKAPMAHKLVKRVVKETQTAAITLHGRSRQQRYTKEANWDYISEVAQVLRDTEAELEDDKDRHDFQKIQFVGNGDVFNFMDYYNAIEDPNIDSVMVARGALIKPWIFEEIESKQYLDKSATERLSIIEKYSKFAMDHWGTDDFGISTARRFLCEFLSFFHRYVPYGILEQYPIKLNQRPEYWKGRNELETLLGSDDYKDWIKISEMFLGPVTESFKFTPKHKSNSYEGN